MFVGKRVKLILDKEVGPDNHLHGETGTITRVVADSAQDVTGDPMDSLLFEVELDSGEDPDLHFRWDDIVFLDEHEEALSGGRE